MRENYSRTSVGEKVWVHVLLQGLLRQCEKLMLPNHAMNFVSQEKGRQNKDQADFVGKWTEYNLWSTNQNLSHCLTYLESGRLVL